MTLRRPDSPGLAMTTGLATATGLAGAWAWAVIGCVLAPEASAERSLVTVIDNSRADSIIEIDRTADLQIGRGSAGSDHDGSTAVATGLLGTALALPETDEESGE
ncbi:hypothetical protein ACFVVU_18875 [Kitasatospora sp. NPDC057965]|uniref:hypothetical protein n=1 Tax=Kitasatospora sp. NPDC057965 TaxID=3346291 RepID=UPI0036DD495B